jgi:hypothetical protein
MQIEDEGTCTLSAGEVIQQNEIERVDLHAPRCASSAKQVVAVLGKAPHGPESATRRHSYMTNSHSHMADLRDLGVQITETRELRDLTIEQLALRTRLSTHLLRRMEAGDFAVCGGDVYARGHLRVIAQVLEVHPAGLIESYALARAAETRRPSVTSERTRRPQDWPRLITNHNLPRLVLLLICLVIGLGILLPHA